MNITLVQYTEIIEFTAKNHNLRQNSHKNESKSIHDLCHLINIMTLMN